MNLLELIIPLGLGIIATAIFSNQLIKPKKKNKKNNKK